MSNCATRKQLLEYSHNVQVIANSREAIAMYSHDDESNFYFFSLMITDSFKTVSVMNFYLPSCHFGEHMVSIIQIGNAGSIMAMPMFAKQMAPY